MDELRAAVRSADWASGLSRVQVALTASASGDDYHLRCFEGLCLSQLSRHAEAADAYRCAMELRPNEAAGARGLVALAAVAPAAVDDLELCTALQALRAVEPSKVHGLAGGAERTAGLLLLLDVLHGADCPLSDTTRGWSCLCMPPSNGGSGGSDGGGGDGSSDVGGGDGGGSGE